jgi:hypothetical protein
VLEGLAERTRDPEKRAKYEAELVVPPFPMALQYLWSVFWRLRRRKPQSIALDWHDIVAFVSLTGARLAPWEVEVIERLDDLLMTPPKVNTDPA